MFDRGVAEPTEPTEPTGAGGRGPETVALAWLERLDISAAGPDVIVSGLETLRALSGWIAATELELLAAAQRHQDHVDNDEKHWFSEEIAAALSADAAMTRTRMMLADDLVTRLPDTFDALVAGRISPYQAQLLSEAVHGLPDADTSAIEARVLPRASEQTTSQFRRSLTRARNQVVPDIVEQDAAAILADRTVTIRPDQLGMSTVSAHLATPGALRLETALNHYATTATAIERTQSQPADQAGETGGAGDGARDTGPVLQTIDQLRADALVALADHYLADPASYHGPAYAQVSGRVTLKPVIQVTVALSTLLGIDDQPSELAGHGPIPASLARHIAGDQNSTWRRIVTDPVGKPIDYGTTRYKPPTTLDRYIRAKHPICAYPTCNRTTISCELDHIKPRNQHDPTNAENLIPLCGRHHHLKHEAGWSMNHDPNTDTTTWTTPHHRTYTNHPDPLPIDHTAHPGGNTDPAKGETG